MTKKILKLIPVLIVVITTLQCCNKDKDYGVVGTWKLSKWYDDQGAPLALDGDPCSTVVIKKELEFDQCPDNNMGDCRGTETVHVYYNCDSSDTYANEFVYIFDKTLLIKDAVAYKVDLLTEDRLTISLATSPLAKQEFIR